MEYNKAGTMDPEINVVQLVLKGDTESFRILVDCSSGHQTKSLNTNPATTFVPQGHPVVKSLLIQ